MFKLQENKPLKDEIILALQDALQIHKYHTLELTRNPKDIFVEFSGMAYMIYKLARDLGGTPVDLSDMIRLKAKKGQMDA